MIAAGAADQAIVDKLGVNRMAISRHRHNHIMLPARAVAEMAGKGREAVEQRAHILAAVEAGDPMAFIGLAGIVADLRRVHERLERTAEAAEQDSQRLAVSALSAQQLRAAEVRAKMGGVGGYGGLQAANQSGTQFAVNIIFSGGQVEQITTIAHDDQGHELDHDDADEAERR